MRGFATSLGSSAGKRLRAIPRAGGTALREPGQGAARSRASQARAKELSAAGLALAEQLGMVGLAEQLRSMSVP